MAGLLASDRGPAVVKLLFIVAGKPRGKLKENSMAQVRAKWLAFYSEHVEPVSKEIFSHVEKLIIGTLIVSAGAHVSSNRAGDRAVRLSAPWSRRPRRDVIRRYSPAAELRRRPLQARQGSIGILRTKS
jgi:hypothetical protein